MKFEVESPSGEKRTLELKPQSGRWFQTVCSLVAFKLYVRLTSVIVSMDNYFALLWFFGLTLAVIAIKAQRHEN